MGVTSLSGLGRAVHRYFLRLQRRTTYLRLANAKYEGQGTRGCWLKSAYAATGEISREQVLSGQMRRAREIGRGCRAFTCNPKRQTSGRRRTVTSDTCGELTLRP
jgi:hypothetical protein